MLSRSLLVRSGPLRTSVILATRACSRSLSTLHLARSARCVVPSCTNLRRFSTAPTLPTEEQDDEHSITPSGTCFIGNIPYKVTAEQLKEAFSTFGKIDTVKLMVSDAGLSRGMAFIRFESVADAVHFVDAHKADPIFVLDRQLNVGHAKKIMVAPKRAEPSDTLLVPKFQGKSEVEARAMFGSYAYNVQAVRFIEREAHLAWRKAFIQFSSVDTAMEAMEAFQNQNESTEILYATPNPRTSGKVPFTSRESQHRAQ